MMLSSEQKRICGPGAINISPLRGEVLLADRLIPPAIPTRRDSDFLSHAFAERKAGGPWPIDNLFVCLVFFGLRLPRRI